LKSPPADQPVNGSDAIGVEFAFGMPGRGQAGRQSRGLPAVAGATANEDD